MNITEEGKKMPMGIAFDKDAEDMIKGKIGASKAKKAILKKERDALNFHKQPKPNMQYQDLEVPRETWEDVFAKLGSNSIDSFMDKLTTEYHPPVRKKTAY